MPDVCKAGSYEALSGIEAPVIAPGSTLSESKKPALESGPLAILKVWNGK
jgi:hypothetical protein